MMMMMMMMIELQVDISNMLIIFFLLFSWLLVTDHTPIVQQSVEPEKQNPWIRHRNAAVQTRTKPRTLVGATPY